MKRPHVGDWIVLFIVACFVAALIFGLTQEKENEAYSAIAISR